MNTSKIIFKNTLIVAFTFLMTLNGFSQTLQKTKAQKTILAKTLSEDMDFNSFLLTSSIMVISIDIENKANAKKMISEYESLIKQPINRLKSKKSFNQLSRPDLEEVINEAIDLIVKDNANSVAFKSLESCLNRCKSDWSSCASIGWKEGMLIGCTAAVIFSAIIADYFTGGAASPVLMEYLLWGRNACATALGVSFTALQGACWENYRVCVDNCNTNNN